MRRRSVEEVDLEADDLLRLMRFAAFRLLLVHVRQDPARADAPGAPEQFSKTMLILSADMNYWAALGAFCTGAALVLSAMFED